MYIDLSGEWNISLEADDGPQYGVIKLPGILQASGYGNPITRQTPWVGSLHDSFWYEQEEYKFAQEECVNVPFLAQPPRHFLGEAVYERRIFIPEEDAGSDIITWHFHAELARWRSQVWIDGELRGEDCTLCAPHDIEIGRLSAGEHMLRVILDTSMIYPYRPDAHGVSDALGATWNGMAGETALFTDDVAQERKRGRQEYAAAHPRSVCADKGIFKLDGAPFYFRATHFGGEYPLTGYPATDPEWWRRIMRILKEWGLNGIRFHSNCPPEAAFAAADEEGICLLVECGMWNCFVDGSDGAEMEKALRRETRKILENFGHHPSFVFFSPTNEPGGAWYVPLARWVEETREYDRRLGYGGRRLYTAQSGWFYDVPPAQIKGPDFIYFHRSGYGPYPGGTIRNPKGWYGGDYSPSLEGVKQPVVCHELGQICAYPDFSVIDKFTGYLHPGNYMVFRENARANGLLANAEEFARCSGENQLRLYKEELEADFRTPEIQGFELLDLHDYLGQGTALVGILDAFWESKGYGSPEEFRHFCGDTVLLARCGSYVWKNTDTAVIPVEICHYGAAEIPDGVIHWTLCQGEDILKQGELAVGLIARGGNTKTGDIVLSFEEISENAELTLALTMDVNTSSMLQSGDSEDAETFVQKLHRQDLQGQNPLAIQNSWKLYVFSETQESQSISESQSIPEPQSTLESQHNSKSQTAEASPDAAGQCPVLYTRDWQEAKTALNAGGRVVYAPYLSDLNYECPALSGRSVGWNSQMGPTWCRDMGVVIDEKHPIFRHFPTGKSGGWQWEDILKHSRGFHMDGLQQIEPIVRSVDDWNRNLSLGMMFEARVLNGTLLFVAADLSGSFEERPAAFCLRQAVMRYAASEEFTPQAEAAPEVIEEKFFPMLRMRALTEAISYDSDGEVLRVRNGGAIAEADPNTSVRVEKKNFPICITMILKKSVVMRGIVYVPEQRDRDHEGFVKKYMLEVRDGKNGCWKHAAEGTFLNTSRSQQALFDRELAGDALRITILSAYGCVDKYVWEEQKTGWFRVCKPQSAVVQIAGIHIVCDEESPCGDSFSSEKEGKSKTREIEL